MKRLVFLFLACCFINSSMAQNRILLSDRTSSVDQSMKEKLRTDLASFDIELLSVLNADQECDYVLVLLKQSPNYNLTFKNCDGKTTSTKNFNGDFELATADEKVVLLSMAIRRYFAEPKINIVQVEPDPILIKDSLVQLEKLMNEHSTRHFFAPTAYNLRKHEFYYNTMYFGAHDLQYGISDNFSFGMGTSIALMPIYFTPKVSVDIDEKNHLSFGTLFATGTYLRNWYVNLAFANYTYGSEKSNITLSAGYLTAGNREDYSDLVNIHNKGVLSISGMTSMGPHLYFLTENYFVFHEASQDGWKNDPVDQWAQLNTTLQYNSSSLFGFVGTRWVNKRVDTRSWQFGVAYYANMPDKADFESKSKQAPYSDYTFLNPEEKIENFFLVLPAVGFTYKFGQEMK